MTRMQKYALIEIGNPALAVLAFFCGLFSLIAYAAYRFEPILIVDGLAYSIALGIISAIFISIYLTIMIKTRGFIEQMETLFAKLNARDKRENNTQVSIGNTSKNTDGTAYRHSYKAQAFIFLSIPLCFMGKQSFMTGGDIDILINMMAYTTMSGAFILGVLLLVTNASPSSPKWMITPLKKHA